ncbi:MAG: hypothetical protein ACK5V3_01935, partial [Bdellovibrionales bacterium]
LKEYYYSQPQNKHPQYYKSQFDDNNYKGKNFFHYFQNENNVLAMLLETLLLSEQDPKDLLKSLNLT